MLNQLQIDVPLSRAPRSVVSCGSFLQVVQFDRREGAVLQQLPIALPQGFDRLAAVQRPAFAADEIEVRAAGLGCRSPRSVGSRLTPSMPAGGATPGRFERRGEMSMVSAMRSVRLPGLMLARPAGGARHAQTAFIHVRLAAAPRAVVGAVGEHAAVVGGENHQRVLRRGRSRRACRAPGRCRRPDARSAPPASARFSVMPGSRCCTFSSHSGLRLDGIVRRVVGQVEEEWLRLAVARSSRYSQAQSVKISVAWPFGSIASRCAA